MVPEPVPVVEPDTVTQGAELLTVQGQSDPDDVTATVADPPAPEKLATVGSSVIVQPLS